jgi:HlyD family secretion protein
MRAMRARRGRLLYWLPALGAAILLVVALRPEPVAVQTATVLRGPLQVTVEEEAETRAHDRFVVAAPVSGRLLRVELHDGDPVEEGQVVARIAPAPLGPRECAEQEARVEAAEARHQEANDILRHAQTDYEQARRESERMQNLVQRGLVAKQTAEQAKNLEITSRNELDAARGNVAATAAAVELAKAGLIAADACDGSPANILDIRSPVRGQVLRIVEQSERVVAAGEPLLTLGDPAQIEVVVDVLSSEAVKVSPGMPALLENWGGDRPLRATVRVVEPYAYTKVSALGIEEQRVNIVLDLDEREQRLGDGFRADARIIVWERQDALKAPTSAVFRYGDGLAAFVLEDDRVRRRAVSVGRRGTLELEVLDGLEEGERVVIHPPNELDDGSRVTADAR